MSHFDLTPNQRAFVKAIADAAGSARKSSKNGSRTCPKWLLDKYMDFQPRYAFASTKASPATLEEIKVHETGEYVAIYANKVFDTNCISKPWTERYMWVWRGNRMVQLSQWGGNSGWRRLKGM